MTTYILRLSILYLSLRVRVRMFIMASQTAGPICIKLGMGTWVDPGNILGEVKVKVERRRRENRGVARRRYVVPRSNAEGERIEVPIGRRVRPEDG